MKTNSIYLKRLLRLANHLGSKYVEKIIFENKQFNFTCEKGGSNIEHFNWAFDELTLLDRKN